MSKAIIGTWTAIAAVILAFSTWVYADRIDLENRVSENTEAVRSLKEAIRDIQEDLNSMQQEQRDFYRFMYEKAGEESRAEALTKEDK